jgi:CNT family concentrative nucleoside transporter
LLALHLSCRLLYSPWGQRVINGMSKGVLAVIGFSQAGIDMVFGPLADTDIIGFSFAINVLPIIIFFAALMSVLYHLGIMQILVKIVGGALHRFIGTGAIESQIYRHRRYRIHECRSKYIHRPDRGAARRQALPGSRSFTR